MPPGTGDVALSLSQTVPVAGADRRHHAAAGVARRQPARRADVSEAQHPDARHRREHELLRVPELPPRERHLRASAAASRWRPSSAMPFLGRLPVYQPISLGSDRGIPLVIAEPDAPGDAGVRSRSPSGSAAQVSIAAHRNAVANKGKIPLIPIGKVGRWSDRSSRSGRSVGDDTDEKNHTRDRNGDGFVGSMTAAELPKALVDPYLQVQVALSTRQVRRRRRRAPRRSRPPRRRSARMPRRSWRRAKKLGAAKDIAAARTAFGELSDAAGGLRREDQERSRRGVRDRVLPDGRQAVAAEGQGDQESRTTGPRCRPAARSRSELSASRAIPSSGPGTSSSAAHRQPVTRGDPRQQLDRHHRQQESEAGLERQRRADVIGRRVLADERRELRRVGDDGEAPDHHQHEHPDRRAAEDHRRSAPRTRHSSTAPRSRRARGPGDRRTSRPARSRPCRCRSPETRPAIRRRGAFTRPAAAKLAVANTATHVHIA